MVVPINIAVISDIHIKSNSRHNEYKEYFNLLYEELKKLNLDVVIIPGDVFHSKTVQSPDAYNLCFDFFRKLMSLNVDLHVLPGNHDMNEKNLQKMDAIYPIIQELNRSPGLTDYPFYDVVYDNKSFDTQPTCFDGDFGEQIVFRHFSLADKQNWNYSREGLDNDTILVGIYHGPLKGVKTDLGYVFTSADDVEKFKELDYMFCGDIHTRFSYDDSGRKISVGNLIQQDFGESLVKGFMFYKIYTRTKFESKFIEIPNLYPFITLNVGDDLPLNLIETAKGVRLKFNCGSFADQNREYISAVSSIVGDKLISKVLLNKPVDNFINGKNISIKSFGDYIKDYPNKNSLIQIHDEYLKKISIKTNSSNWRIKKLKWNNLFSYGEDNEFDFEKIKNMSIGVFGANYSGKTSLIDVICFSLFGSWTKPFVKLVHFINDNKSFADVYVEFEVNSKIYSVYRKLEKKKGKNESTLDFQCLTDNKNLNGVKTTDTQKYIIDLIGDMDDFMITSLSTQFNNFSLIDEKNSKRKEYFSKFLGITQYEQIYELVKTDLKDLKKEIEIIQKYDNIFEQYSKLKIILPEKIDETSERLIFYDIQREEWLKLNREFEKIEKQYKEQYSQKEVLNLLNKQRISIKNNIDKFILEMNKSKDSLAIVDFNEDLLISYRKLKIEQEIKLKEQEIFLKDDRKQLKELEESEELLKSVPCGNSFPECKFLIKANSKLKDKNVLMKRIELADLFCHMTENTIKSLNDDIKKEEEKKNKNESNQFHEKNINKLQQSIVNLSFELNELEKEILEKENKSIKNIETEKIYNELKIQIDKLRSERDDNFIKFKTLESEIKNLMEQKLSLEDKIGKFKEKEKLIQSLEQYSELVGKNGIIISILNGYIPAIESLMNEIISNMANFNVKLVIEEDKYIEIYIQDEISSRLIETASGSQKTIVAYALRLAILSYSQICSSDLFILDEPGTALDSDHLLEFTKLLDILKANQKTIILVTHISSLKDCVDIIYTVDKSSGYSKIIT